jgi:hypothetical protein
LPAGRLAFKLFNKQLSIFCSKHEYKLNKLHGAVQESTQAGHYLRADALLALIKSFVCLGQLDRLREMYVNSHMALTSLDRSETRSLLFSGIASRIR